MQTITIILYPGCIFFEIALAAELLATKYKISYVTPNGEDHIASNGARIKALCAYDKINLENCKGLLIPGGDPRSIVDNTVIDEVIRSAHESGLWLAAICAGPSVLAKAGVLKGTRIAHGYGKEQLEFLKSYFLGVELTDEQFVCDKNIITAKPEAHIDFAVEIACRLGVVDASRANRTKEYYRGILGRKIRPLALALIKNKEDKYLFHKAHDKVKNEWFYRPLGGGIEFSESGSVALKREIMEELGLESQVGSLVASFENIFTFEGIRGHEIIMLFHARFLDESAYEAAELDIYESGMSIAKAVWRSVPEMKAEGAKVYPVGLEAYL
ncbi:MAG: DJ-1/PfpI family protein [Bacteriovorax sp.]|jgi:putative intracellular protease/amidase/8-oxo-dGTP pyrophosphatase MutT (NUDIX family)